MAKTTLRELGTSVIVSSDGDEEIIVALGDGTAVPGDLVAILATGKVVGTDVAAVEDFTGILLEAPITGTETAIVDGIKCSVVIPKSGHRYRIRILDQNADLEIGHPLTFSGTPGKATTGATAILGKIGTVARPCPDDDTVVEMRWA